MEKLEDLSTKTLLSYLGSARRLGGSYNPYYDSGYAPSWSRSFTIAEIKAVLTTREHIPNKLERRTIRQQKAKKRV